MLLKVQQPQLFLTKFWVIMTACILRNYRESWLRCDPCTQNSRFSKQSNFCYDRRTFDWNLKREPWKCWILAISQGVQLDDYRFFFFFQYFQKYEHIYCKITAGKKKQADGKTKKLMEKNKQNLSTENKKQKQKNFKQLVQEGGNPLRKGKIT